MVLGFDLTLPEYNSVVTFNMYILETNS